MEDLTAAALRATSHPILLHVRRPGKGTPFLHWVLFLGMDGDQARILDPPDTVELWPLAQLLSLWDGKGLVVSRGPPTTVPVFMASWFEKVTALLLVCLTIGALAVGLRARRGQPVPSASPCRGWAAWRRGGLRAAGLFVAACGLAGAWHLLIPEGFWLNRAAVAQVVLRHFKVELPTVTVDEVEAALDRPDTIFIDARLRDDFDAGHIGNAMHLPVFAGLGERNRALATIRLDNRVIIYCQSDHCPWGTALAADMHFRGYRNVALFPGGWNAWVQHERSKQRP